MTAAVVALGVVVGLLAVLVVGLLRSHADILRALHDLGVGEDDLATPGGAATALSRSRNGATADPGIRTLPGVAEPGASTAIGRLVDIGGVDPHGGAVRIGLGGAASPTLLAFLSTGCSTCADFWRAFGTDELDQVPGDGTRVVVVTRGPEEESPAGVAGLASPRVSTVMSSEAWDAYGIPMSPYFVLVDGTRGVIGEGAAASLGAGDRPARQSRSRRRPRRRRPRRAHPPRPAARPRPRGAGRPGAGRRRHRARIARPLPGPPPDRRGRRHGAAHRRAAVSTPVLVVGLVSAVLGAVRASWSP